jgi:trk system potassium uptake protein TrkA
MRAIICGAGQVGYSIAAYLASEENDVTVIDQNAALIGQINSDMDVNAVVGHASNPDVLNSAGAKDADMMIAATQSDEVNMVACQIGHSLFGIPKKIARIREQAYLDPAWSNLFSRSHMPIDVIISPEVVIANDIYQRLSVPGTTYVIPLADGLAHMVGVICEEKCPILYTPLGQLANLFPDLSFEIVAILRNNKPIIPDETDQLEVGDEVYFVVDTKHLQRTMVAFGHDEERARRIVVAGGGNIGTVLVDLIKEKRRGIQVKIIEHNEAKAQKLSERFEDVIVLQGNCLQRDILDEASIENVETFVAITNDDETNILGSLLAKQYGCSRVITLVNNNAYSPLVGPLGVDAMVSPRATIVAQIMQHVRRGRIKAIHNLRDGFAEVIEAEISDKTNVVNKTLGEIELPPNVIIGAVIRDDKVIMPTSDLMLHEDDHAIILTARDSAQEVEKIFSVHVDLF